MPDAPAPAAEPTPAPTPDPTPEPTDDLGEKGEKALELWKQRAKAAEAEAKRTKTLEAKLKEIEDAGKSEMQRATDEAAAAKAEAAKATQAYLRLKIGTDKGLPASLAGRLQGETEEEMAADADALLKDFKPKNGTGSFEAGPRQPAPAGTDMNQMIRRAAGRTT